MSNKRVSALMSAVLMISVLSGCAVEEPTEEKVDTKQNEMDEMELFDPLSFGHCLFLPVRIPLFLQL